MSINTGLAAIVTTDGRYGENILAAGFGTLGGHGISKMKFKNPVANQVMAPIFSGVASEYLSDPDLLKKNGWNNENNK